MSRSKSPETGWPVLIRHYRPKSDWAGSTRYKSVEGAAKGSHYRLSTPIAVGGPWIVDGDEALYVEGCEASDFLALVTKENERVEKLLANEKHRREATNQE